MLLTKDGEMEGGGVCNLSRISKDIKSMQLLVVWYYKPYRVYMSGSSSN